MCVCVKKKKNRFLQCARAAPRAKGGVAASTRTLHHRLLLPRAHARAFEIRARARAARFRPLRERGASGVSRFFFFLFSLRVYTRNIRRGKTGEWFGLLFLLLLLLLLFRVFFLPFFFFILYMYINIGTPTSARDTYYTARRHATTLLARATAILTRNSFFLTLKKIYAGSPSPAAPSF